MTVKIKKYKIGDKISGSVKRLTPFGAFIELEDGLEYIENNPEEFERFKEYRDVLINLRKLGYEVGKKYPLPRNPKNSFKIYSVNIL